MGLIDGKELSKDIVQPAIVQLDAETIPAFFAKVNELKNSLDGWTLVIKEITIELHAPKVTT